MFGLRLHNIEEVLQETVTPDKKIIGSPVLMNYANSVKYSFEKINPIDQNIHTIFGYLSVKPGKTASLFLKSFLSIPPRNINKKLKTRLNGIYSLHEQEKNRFYFREAIAPTNDFLGRVYMPNDFTMEISFGMNGTRPIPISTRGEFQKLTKEFVKLGGHILTAPCDARKVKDIYHMQIESTDFVTQYTPD